MVTALSEKLRWNYFYFMLNNSVLRYKKEITSNVLNEKIIDLLGKNFVIPDTFSYRLIKVGNDMVARPDLLSWQLYSDDSYGDLICKLNNISNPFEFNEGMTLICPVPDDLWKFFHDDPWTDDQKDNEHPKPKKKKEKRKANEATDGDVRFTVDSNKRIVIY